MKTPSFEAALAYVLVNEGGYVNHALDRGGPTNMGITLHTLSEWRQKPVSVEDVEHLTRDEASDIYFSRYWLVAGCDRVESQPIATAIFDTSVVSGAHTATMYCQMALNILIDNLGAMPKIVEDGRAGPTTIAWLNRVTPAMFLAVYHDLLFDRCVRIVEKHPEQKVFLTGWTNRAKRLLTLLPRSTDGKAIV